jgi:recombination protein RecR
LGGVIQVGNAGQDLKIHELLTRVENEKITEVILATNPTTEGDATALYLKRKLQTLTTNPDNITKLRITRLGRGLSTGADLEYADEITLSSALTNRTELL